MPMSETSQAENMEATVFETFNQNWSAENIKDVLNLRDFPLGLNHLSVRLVSLDGLTNLRIIAQSGIRNEHWIYRFPIHSDTYDRWIEEDLEPNACFFWAAAWAMKKHLLRCYIEGPNEWLHDWYYFAEFKGFIQPRITDTYGFHNDETKFTFLTSRILMSE